MKFFKAVALLNPAHFVGSVDEHIMPFCVREKWPVCSDEICPDEDARGAADSDSTTTNTTHKASTKCIISEDWSPGGNSMPPYLRPPPCFGDSCCQSCELYDRFLRQTNNTVTSRRSKCSCTSFSEGKCFAPGCTECPEHCIGDWDVYNKVRTILGSKLLCCPWEVQKNGVLGLSADPCEPCCQADHGLPAGKRLGEWGPKKGVCCVLDCPCTDWGSDCTDALTAIQYIGLAILKGGWLVWKNLPLLVFAAGLKILVSSTGKCGLEPVSATIGFFSGP